MATLQVAHRTPFSLLWHHRPYDKERRSAHLRGRRSRRSRRRAPRTYWPRRRRRIDWRFWYAKSITTSSQRRKKDYARFQLSELKQQSHERLSHYNARVREIAKKCDYGTHEEDMIWGHLIQTMLNNKLRRKAIRENWLLDRILTKASLDEQTTEQAEAASKKLDNKRSSESIQKINASRRNRQNKASVGENALV